MPVQWFICLCVPRAGSKQQEPKEDESIKKPAAGGAPMAVGQPIVKLENNGQLLTIRFIITAGAKPTATWTAAGLPVKSGGRYFLNVEPNKANKEEYTIFLEVKAVSYR